MAGTTAPGSGPDDAADAPAMPRNRVHKRAVEAWSEHPSVAGSAVIVVAALAATFLSRWGHYVADFRFEVAWDPGKTLSLVHHARDAEGGLGRPSEINRGVLSSVFFWVPRALGFAPWVAQRLWHATLLSIAGTGAAAMTRRMSRRASTSGQALAGLVYAFGPVSMSLLRPSPVFVVYAVAPWLLLAALRGPLDPHPRRWSAIFALGLLFAVETEIPAVAYLLGLIAVVVVHQALSADGPGFGPLLRWWPFTFVLSVLVCARVIVLLALSRSGLDARLALTESPETPASTSSYSEALRGMGHWLDYFTFGRAPRPHLAPLLESPAVIAATFLLVAVAVGHSFVGKELERWPLAALVCIATMLTVGLYPVDDPTPYGRILGWLFDNVSGASALRNTSKAGPGVALGVAVLAALALDEGRRRASRRWLRRALTGLAVAVVVLAGQPAVTGDLYPEVAAETDVPEYWFEAADFLETLPGDATLLVLPGTNTTYYSWGLVGDDLIAGLVDRHWVRSNGFLTSAPMTADVFDGLEESLTQRLRLFTSPVPLLHELGIDYVVLRNDIDWKRSGVARPAAYTHLATDPGLETVATFGRVSTRFGATDRPAIEVFATGSDPTATVVRSGSEDMVVVGDGGGIAALDSHRALDPAGAFVFADRLTDAEMASALAGGLLVVTDSNVIRERQILGGPVVTSAPVPPGLDNEAASTYDGPGAATVPTVGEARSVTSNVGTVGRPWTRVEQVFDGVGRSTWVVPSLFEGEPRVDVSFDRARTFRRLSLVTRLGPAPAGRVVLDGVVVANFAAGREASVDLGGRSARDLSVVFDDAGTASFAISEIVIDDVDLEPGMRVPDSWLRRAEADPALAAAVADAPIAFSFLRIADLLDPAVEHDLRRTFELDRDRSFQVTGWLTGLFGAAGFDGCRPLVVIDDEAVPVRMTSSGRGDGIAAFESCDLVRLGAGEHQLTSGGAVALETVLLLDTAWRPAVPARPAPARLVEQTLDQIRLEVTLPAGGGLVSSGAAFESGWKVTVDGARASVVAADTLAAVHVTEPGEHRIQFDYGPQRPYLVGLVVTYLGLTAAAVFMIVPARRRAPLVVGSSGLEVEGDVSAAAIAALAALALGWGFLVGWWIGMLIAAAAFAAALLGERVRLAAMVVAAVVFSAAATMIEGDLAVTISYGDHREWAARAAQWAVAAWGGGLLGLLAHRDRG